MMVKKSEEIILRGLSAAPGICIGKAYLVDKEGVDVVPKYRVPQSLVAKEVKRFKAAVKKSRDELRAVIENTPDEFGDHAAILETQEVLLKDKMLYGRTVTAIETEHVNAEWALKKTVAKVKSVFGGMTDDYLKERVTDIVHLSDRIMGNLVGAKYVDIAQIDKRVILVAADLTPAETSQIRLERIKGFVTDRGGKASHTGIIARSLEIPAVLGLGTATTAIKNDDVIIVDGNTGTVIVQPSEKTLIEYEERRSRYESHKAAISRGSRLPAETLDGHHFEIMGNIELPEEVVAVLNYGGDGIGLYRSEFQYMGRPHFPEENELYDKYSDVIQVADPKPVTIRTLDINGDKYLSSGFGRREENPALGLRGIRWCLQRPDVFHTQLRAILRAAVHGNVRIMLPMVSTLSEVIESKKALAAAAESLEKEGLPYRKDIPLGVLIEVPSAVVMADLMAEEVDFFSIGTNDLIQYALAIDRGNKDVSHLFQPLDPAILRLLKHISDVAAEKDIAVYMCGEMAGYAIHTPLLLGLGLKELSMNPQSIPGVKQMIRSIELKSTRSLVDEALEMKSAEKVYQLLRQKYSSIVDQINQTENGPKSNHASG
jgi:phosphotransferase system enzyme I (PtsI)